MSEAKTEVFERPTLIEAMIDQPGSLLLFAAEWAGIALLLVGLLTIIFLLCLGGYELVQKSS